MKLNNLKSKLIASPAVIAAILLNGAPLPLNAQNGTPMQVNISNQSTVQRLVLPKGKSAIVDLPIDARDVVVANPKIADAVMRTAKRGFILGMELGETNVYFLDAQGRQILALEVRVARDTSELGALIDKLAPEARVNIESVGDSMILTGETPDALTADRVVKIAAQYTGAADKVINMMSVKAAQQVMLKVRIIEMQRSVIKQLGVNLSGTNILNKLLPSDWGMSFATANGFSANGSFLGGTTLDASWARNFIRPTGLTYNSGMADLLNPSVFTGAAGYSYTPPITTCTESTTGGAPICNTTPAVTEYGPGESVSSDAKNSSIQALERVGLARTLAEPNLTAISGESAKFLAGGEFPVPSSQDGNRISVEFKSFGVGLGFTPVVLSANRIVLKISAEVSEISTAASFRQPDTIIRDGTGAITDTIRGLSIPGVSTRRAETTLELASGRSIMMAGLIQQQTRQAIEGLPGLKDLPVLGNLFRSRDFVNNETELVIIVTPYLVQSTTLDKLQTPADGYNAASDPNALIMGRLNRMIKPSAAPLPKGEYKAPIGHVLR